MSNRKLASIMTVKEIADIPEKDKIGMISFLETGWQVIGNKDLKPGDKVLYLEYDSIIPEKTLDLMDAKTSEMLKKRCWSAKRNGCVIKCLKMAGQVSYGILFEKKDLTRLFSLGEWEKFEPGTDLTDKLGIFKRDDDGSPISVKEKPSFFSKWYSIIMWKLFKIKKKSAGLGQWPPFLQKTDETRAHALSFDTLEQFRGRTVYITEKIDGQSAAYVLYKNKFYICSRNMALYVKPVKKAIKELTPENANKQTNQYIASACKYDLANAMYAYKTDWSRENYLGRHDFAIFAEQAGSGIQKNPCGLSSVELFVFNVFDLEEKRYYRLTRIQAAVRGLNRAASTSASLLRVVPVLQAETVLEWQTIKDLEEMAKGQTFNGKNKNREGIVIRDCPLGDDNLYIAKPPEGCSNMASFKIINSDYLLNNKEDE